MLYHILGTLMTILFGFLSYKTFTSKKLPSVLKWILLIICVVITVSDLSVAISGKLPEDNEVSESRTDDTDDRAFKKSSKERHYKELNEAVEQLPQKYDLITSAIIDENTGSLVITLSDDVLSATEAQLQNIVKKAWTFGYNLVERNKPYPSDKEIVKISVQDSAENQLGHSGLLKKFKYDVKK